MRTLSLVLAGLLMVGLNARAEEKPDNKTKLIGSWEVVKADEGTLPVGTVVTFTKDGKLKMAGKVDGQEKIREGTFTVDGEKFTVVHKEGEKEHKMTITIKKLTADELMATSDDGKTVEFKRKKE